MKVYREIPKIDLTQNGRFGWGRSPIYNKLENLKFIHYSLQLHVYRYIFVNHYGKNVPKENLYIVLFHPDNESYKAIQAKDVSEEVEYLMQNYNQVLEWHQLNLNIDHESERWLETLKKLKK